MNTYTGTWISISTIFDNPGDISISKDTVQRRSLSGDLLKTGQPSKSRELHHRQEGQNQG